MIDNLRHVRAFLAVARSGNFTRAAKLVHLSQSALTVQIQQLEAALGVKILDRDKRNCRLTPEGLRLLGPMEELLLSAGALSGVALGEDSALSGVVTVVSMPTAGANLLPSAIARFSQRFPHVRVRIKDALSQDVVSLVISGEADFGVTGYIGIHRDLSFIPLFQGTLCAYVNGKHPFATRKKLPLRAICGEPLILTDRVGSLRNIFEAAVEKAQLSYRLAFEINQISTAIGLVSAGLGVAILNESAFVPSHAENVVRVEICNPSIPRSISAVKRKDHTLSQAADALLRELRDTKLNDLPSLIRPIGDTIRTKRRVDQSKQAQ